MKWPLQLTNLDLNATNVHIQFPITLYGFMGTRLISLLFLVPTPFLLLAHQDYKNNTPRPFILKALRQDLCKTGN